MSWRQVFGHKAQIERFRHAVGSGRLGHAYLFVGPSGIGKKHFAVELAKALLCENPPELLAACDSCAACHLVDAGTHPDLTVTGKPADKLEFPIDTMRELCAALALKPARGRRRVAIVDDVDDFNDEAANCFLKTLEEPPPFSLLVLIGSNVERQLSTIRSRCQIIAFDRLSDAEVKSVLSLGATRDANQLQRLVRIADGSPGRAHQFADPALWEFRRMLLEQLTQPKPDGPAVARAWMELIERCGKDSALQRSQAARVLELIYAAFRGALHFATGLALTESEDSKMLHALASRFGVDGLMDRMERLLEAEAHIDRRVQLVLLVEAVVDAVVQDRQPALRPAWGTMI